MEHDWPGAVVSNRLNGVDALEGGDTSQKGEVFAGFVVGLPVIKVVVVGHHPFVVLAVAAFFSLVVVHPRIGLKDAEAGRHQRGVADAGFDVLVIRELSH